MTENPTMSCSPAPFELAVGELAKFKNGKLPAPLTAEDWKVEDSKTQQYPKVAKLEKDEQEYLNQWLDYYFVNLAKGDLAKVIGTFTPFTDA